MRSSLSSLTRRESSSQGRTSEPFVWLRFISALPFYSIRSITIAFVLSSSIVLFDAPFCPSYLFDTFPYFSDLTPDRAWIVAVSSDASVRPPAPSSPADCSPVAAWRDPTQHASDLW